MTDTELIWSFIQMAEANCSGSSHLCTCLRVTDIWERVEPELKRRGAEAKRARAGEARGKDA